ncbi:MAG: hydroxymethylglutaryl-CoA reductase, degradative [Candidatus Lokiarchaeota archaeon]|nr:hydroxymethylglutaryl-CoA reductase, degradative [Candidatus Lokiarchaeota archaeon]MBD3342924.1 hydroxymethylglutaryl-CoA reductase, degradative [Candidatus Lokiarchaeota archaeon]
MKKTNSKISGFYQLSIRERQELLKKLIGLIPEETELLENTGYFSEDQLDTLIENVVGSYQLPIGIACNFKINGKDYLIPMVIEESSVVAAASNVAKIARKHGGFNSEEVNSIMIGQIQLTNVKNLDILKLKLEKEKDKILKIANDQDPLLNKLGGGAFDCKFREISTERGKMLIIHLLVDVLDAMGANVVNTMAEAISPFIEEISGGKIFLRIVSNLAAHRVAKSKAVFDKELLGGTEVVNGILNAYHFALNDPYRAATHNKGIMNGIIALALATGNDTRAIEAGAHAYASLKNGYKPLTEFDVDENGNLVGKIEIPLALGIVGGLTKVHPMARLLLKILNVKSANELSQVAAALGLAQNVAALRALASEGIQKGHMKLHSKNIAKLAGVPDEYIEKVAKILIDDQKIRVDYAQEVYKKIKKDLI